MKFLAVLLFISVAYGFRVSRPMTNKYAGVQRTDIMRRTMSYSNDENLVPLDKVNIENSAAVTGGILGFVLGGPVFALIFAAVSNYVSKKENESGEAIRGVGKTVIESYNFLNKLNTKYSVTDKIGEAAEKAVGSIESDSDIVDKVKTTYSSTTGKFKELDEQYELVSKGKEVLVASATLSDAAIDKLVELNNKYDFVQTTKKAATDAVDKVKDQTK